MQSALPFASEEMFSLAWFYFVKLQKFDGDMLCPICGPTPEDTIWDGVTLAYGEKYLLPSLCPPTTVSKDAPQKDSRYIRNQQAIPNRILREAIRKICQQSIKGLTPVAADRCEMEMLDSEEDEDDVSGIEQRRLAKQAKQAAKKVEEFQERVKAIPLVLDGLSKLCPGLEDLFEREFGVSTLEEGIEPNITYRRLFLNVSPKVQI